LLAATSDGLMRSDDAGDSWYQVGAGQNVIYVDPTNQDVLYATSTSDPLLRSSDGGTSWTPLMAGQPFTGKALDAIAASPVDPNILYVGLKLPGISDEYWLYRSNDSGSNWTQLFHSQNTLCGWGTQLIVPHPTDISRLIFSAGCHAGRDFFEIVQQSTNQGQTFSEWYAVRQITGDAPTGFPKSLVGGQGAAPQRWYLAMNRDQRFGGSVLVRSDDDGASWDTILDYQGGGTFAQNSTDFSVRMAAMAYDAANPDTVYVARNSAYPGFPPTPVTSGVTVTADGGQTWNDLGNQQTGTIADLAFGIDGRFLFLATERGVARMALQ
jgi:photosystem II stability/assembly factor-like uncharacterized protein